MAGLGRKVFGRERLTSADVNGYLMDQVIMTFPSVSARDAAIPTAARAEGMHAYTTDTDQEWVFRNGVWTWPKAAQGQLARADFVETSGVAPRPGRTPLSHDLANLPAFNVTVPLIPPGRHVRVSFSLNASADQDATGYQFLMIFAGIQRRMSVHLPVANNNLSFVLPYTFDTTSALVNQTGGILQGGWLYGPGNSFLHSTGIDGPTQFLVEDLGGV